MPPLLLCFVADQVSVAPDQLNVYAQRDETRREHLAELLTTYGWRTVLSELPEASALPFGA